MGTGQSSRQERSGLPWLLPRILRGDLPSSLPVEGNPCYPVDQPGPCDTLGQVIESTRAGLGSARTLSGQPALLTGDGSTPSPPPAALGGSLPPRALGSRFLPALVRHARPCHPTALRTAPRPRWAAAPVPEPGAPADRKGRAAPVTPRIGRSGSPLGLTLDSARKGRGGWPMESPRSRPALTRAPSAR